MEPVTTTLAAGSAAVVATEIVAEILDEVLEASIHAGMNKLVGNQPTEKEARLATRNEQTIFMIKSGGEILQFVDSPSAAHLNQRERSDLASIGVLFIRSGIKSFKVSAGIGGS